MHNIPVSPIVFVQKRIEAMNEKAPRGAEDDRAGRVAAAGSAKQRKTNAKARLDRDRQRYQIVIDERAQTT
jgi:hypothetical protein